MRLNSILDQYHNTQYSGFLYIPKSSGIYYTPNTLTAGQFITSKQQPQVQYTAALGPMKNYRACETIGKQRPLSLIFITYHEQQRLFQPEPSQVSNTRDQWGKYFGSRVAGQLLTREQGFYDSICPAVEPPPIDRNSAYVALVPQSGAGTIYTEQGKNSARGKFFYQAICSGMPCCRAITDRQ